MLNVYEPRYLRLVRRCMDDGALFGLQPTAGAGHGAAIRITACRDGMPPPVLMVSGVAERRYELPAPPVQDAGEGLGLYTGAVRYIDDLPLAGDPSVASVGGIPGPAAPLDAGDPEVAALPADARRALADLPHDHARAVAVRNALATIITRALARSRRQDAAHFIFVHGALPGDGATLSRWSFFAADALGLPPESKRAAFMGVNPLARLLVCYGWVAAQAATVPAGDGGEDAAAAGLTDAGLSLFPHLPAHVLFPVVREVGAPLLSWVWLEQLSRRVSRSPALINLAVMVAVLVAVYLLRREQLAGGGGGG